jgi:phosphoglycolate phosphatase
VQGKKLVFVTNNSRKSRRQYSKKFKSLGLDVTEVVFDTTIFL